MKSKDEVIKEFQYAIDSIKEIPRLSEETTAAMASATTLAVILVVLLDIRDELADTNYNLEAIKNYTGRLP